MELDVDRDEAGEPRETGYEMYEHALGKLVMRGEIDAQTMVSALNGYSGAFSYEDVGAAFPEVPDNIILGEE